MAAGYWQIEMDERDRHKTAFLTKPGLFEHVNMAQGFCIAPDTFQRVRFKDSNIHIKNGNFTSVTHKMTVIKTLGVK